MLKFALLISSFALVGIGWSQAETPKYTQGTEINNGDTCRIELPSYFFGHGDSMHDCWMATTNCQIESYSLELFNRWGSILFTTDDPLYCFDGVVDDKALQAGTYFYLVKAVFTGREETSTFSGSVVVER